MGQLKNWALIFSAIISIFPQILANIPGVEIFSKILPPADKEVAKLIALGVGFLILAIVWFWKIKRKSSNTFPAELKMALLMFIFSLFFIFLLLKSLGFTTIFYAGNTFQIGFWDLDWSLTAEGSKMKIDKPGNIVAWLMTSGGKPIYWTKTSMELAAILNLILYLLAFSGWTACFALVGKAFYEMDMKILK
ncbi:MAG: hypothetical protein AB1403_07645 [Candidatus Riflebacteria bacterium]